MQNKIQNSNLKSQKFLEKIIEQKKSDLSKQKEEIEQPDKLMNKDSVKSDTSSFLNIFKEGNSDIYLIAEIKFASPSNANLGSEKELLSRAKQYESTGANAISLITEKHFFKGDISYISQVKKEIALPILQKDFVIDSAQIYEAKKAGSDALLLIARLVDQKKLQEFVLICFSLGIEPVVEINNEEDLEKAIATDTRIIAVNARDLDTFAINVTDACVLVTKIPEKFIKLGFSGIHSSDEVLQYKKAGVNGILVGTSLMKANDIKKFINSLGL